jgi:hypothetical protein
MDRMSIIKKNLFEPLYDPCSVTAPDKFRENVLDYPFFGIAVKDHG